MTALVRARDDSVITKAPHLRPAPEDTASNGGTMSGEERRRRAIAAQGFAAIALFVFAHGARAATPVVQAASAGSAAVHVVAR